MNEVENAIAYRLRIRPDFALGRFHRQVIVAAYSWRLLLKSIESGTFWDLGSQRATSVPKLDIPDEERPVIHELLQTVNAEVILGVCRALVDYVDTILGLKELQGGEIRLEDDIQGESELSQYIESIISERARSIGANKSLQNRSKIDQIGCLPDEIRSSILDLLDIRNALEHHKRVATRKDLTLRFLRLRVAVDNGPEFDGDRISLLQGHNLVLDFVEETRTFALGEAIVLSEVDIELIIQNLMINVGPALLRSAFPPPEAKDVFDPTAS